MAWFGQAFSESHWVLFRGTDVIVHGDAADEAEARKARQSTNGDVLWFRFEGKAYVTQDKEVMDRIRSSNASQLEAGARLRDGLQNIQEVLRNLAESEKRVADVNQSARPLLELTRSLERRQGDAALREQDLSKMQELLKLQAQRTVELIDAQRVLREIEVSGLRLEQAPVELDILRDLVRSGKAQVTP